MQKYSIFNLVKNAFSGHQNWDLAWKDPTPKKEYELKGLVPNVTFPSGTVIVKKNLFVYYGAADKSCCLATCELNDLLKELL